jgi:flagellar basal-body rod protein FlgG
MTLSALHSAATGMEAYEFNLDTIANNLANAGTTAFKRSRVNFEDLFYQHFKLPGAQDANGQFTPVGIHLGLGVRTAGVETDHREGSLLETGGKLDMAIVGDGFFQLQDPNGQIVYTRAGTFTVNADGAIVMASADIGRLMEPNITVPPGTTDISISGDGVVSVLEPPNQTPTNLGQIQTVKFVNPQGLIQLGENLYGVTDASGSPQVGTPGTEGRGQIRQGFLEASNVEPVRELIDLIKTQRNFELNSQVVQVADQLLQLVANLRRF